MKFCCVVEGLTEYDSIPKLVGRLGHFVVKTLHCKGGNNHELLFEKYFEERVIPRIQGLLEYDADRILVVLDREKRPNSVEDLTLLALTVLNSHLSPTEVLKIDLVIADLCVESLLFADYRTVGKLEIVDSDPSLSFGATLDGKNALTLLKKHLKPSARYDKRRHGFAIASKMKLDCFRTASHSSSFRKFVAFAPLAHPKCEGAQCECQ